MRQVVYNALLKAPVRIAGGLFTVAGFIGSVWPDKVKHVVGDGILVQPIGIALLVAGLIYFALLWLLKPGGAATSSNTFVTTGAPNSLGIGSVVGNVTQNFHVPPISDDKLGEGRSRRLKQGNLAELEPVLGGVSQSTEERCPQMPIWEAVEHVGLLIGDDDSNGSYPEARSEVRQAALEGQLVVWGRKEIPPAHMTAEQKGRTVWSKIRSSYWEEYELNRLSTVDRFDGREHTQLEAFPGKIGERYWSLKVSREAVKRLWSDHDSPQMPELIPLMNAAAELYSELRQKLEKRMPNQSWNDPAKALGKIAQLLLGDGLIPIWANYPPTMQLAVIPEDDAKGYAISDDASEMFDHISTSQRYINVQIAVKDYKRRRAELRAQYGSIRPVAEPTRDVRLAEAVVYAHSGDWEANFDTFGEDEHAFDQCLAAVVQRARDNAITIWGRPIVAQSVWDDQERPYEIVPPHHWREYKLDELRILQGTASSERRSDGSTFGSYRDLMVNSSEFQREWPHHR